MLRFDEGGHCHWSYRIGNYNSFLTWTTREEAQKALGESAGEVVIRHRNPCTCVPDTAEQLTR